MIFNLEFQIQLSQQSNVGDDKIINVSDPGRKYFKKGF